MARPMGGIRITEDTLTPNLKALHPQLHAGLYTLMQFYADRMESYAVANASWSDQTGNARQGLSAKAFSEPQSFAIVLYHTMPYGVWLEVRWSGRYAIILPTIDRHGPEVMAAVSQVMQRMR